MITVYGIKNCDTCRKALKWLEAEGLEHRFHDFRKDGLDAEKVDAWLAAAGVDVLLNKRGTTWRKLDENDRVAAEADSGRLASLLVENPTLIKRPVFEEADRLLVGFGDDVRGVLGA